MPTTFYQILPYNLDYQPYDASHILGQFQLVIFAMLAFTFLMRFGFYPPEIASTVLNSDWLYRRFAPRVGKPFLIVSNKIAVGANKAIVLSAMQIMARLLIIFKHPVTGPITPGPAAITLLTLLMSVLFLVNIL